MSDASREQAKWIHEKEKVILEYSQQNKELSSSVAGRGFLVVPGFMYDVHNDLERVIKTKLSDVNFAILSDSIDRELKQRGLDYDLAFKNASIVWELTKQDLLGQWEQEHADLKRGMEYLEESKLYWLAVNVQARNSILMTEKTRIELLAEALRKQLAEVSDDSADYEVSLAQQKVATATKKLEIIPILQLIVQAETELISEKNLLIALKNNLITMTEGLLQYEAELSRVRMLHIDAKQDLIDANKIVMVLEQELVNAKLPAIALMPSLISARNALIPRTDTLIASKQELVLAKGGLFPKTQNIQTAKIDLWTEDKALIAQKKLVEIAKEKLVSLQSTVVSDQNNLLTEKEKLIPLQKTLISGQNSLLTEKLTLSGDQKALIADKQGLIEGRLITKALMDELTAAKEALLGPTENIINAKIDLFTENQNFIEQKRLVSIAKEQLLSMQASVVDANRELITAKEGLIPLQEDIISSNRELMSDKETLISERQRLIDEKSGLIQLQLNEATAMEGLIAAKETVLVKQAQLVMAKENLISAEKLVMPVEIQLNEAMTEIANKKMELIPIYGAIIAQLSALSAALSEQNSNLISIAAERVLQAQFKVAENVSRMTRATTMIEIDGLLNEIELLRLEMATMKDKGETAALKQDASDIREMAIKEKTILTTINSEGRANNQQVIAKKTETIGLDSASKIRASKEVATSDSLTHGYVAAYQRQTLEEETSFKIETEVTATLSHLLSM